MVPVLVSSLPLALVVLLLPFLDVPFGFCFLIRGAATSSRQLVDAGLASRLHLPLAAGGVYCCSELLLARRLVISLCCSCCWCGLLILLGLCGGPFGALGWFCYWGARCQELLGLCWGAFGLMFLLVVALVLLLLLRLACAQVPRPAAPGSCCWWVFWVFSLQWVLLFRFGSCVGLVSSKVALLFFAGCLWSDLGSCSSLVLGSCFLCCSVRFVCGVPGWFLLLGFLFVLPHSLLLLVVVWVVGLFVVVFSLLFWVGASLAPALVCCLICVFWPPWGFVPGWPQL